MSDLHWLTQVLEVLAALAARAAVRRLDQPVPRLAAEPSAPPSFWLPYRGIRKLFHKDAVLADDASPLFRVAPYVVFGAMVCAAAIIPSMGTRLPFTARPMRSRSWACSPRRASSCRSRRWTSARPSARSARAAR